MSDVLLFNVPEGGTPGAAVTKASQPAAAGSTPFDTVYVDPASSLTLTDDAPPGYTRAIRMTRGGGALTLQTMAGFAAAAGAPIADHVFELWVKVPAARPPGLGATVLARWYSNPAGTFEDRAFELIYDYLGRLSLRDKAGNVALCRTPIDLGTWCRAEGVVRSARSATMKVSEGASSTTHSRGSSSRWASEPVVGFEYRAASSQMLGDVLVGPFRMGAGAEYLTPTIVGHERPLVSAGAPLLNAQPGVRTQLVGTAEGIDAAVASYSWRRVSGRGGALRGAGARRVYEPAATRDGYVETFAFTVTDAAGFTSPEVQVQHTVLPAAEMTGAADGDAPLLVQVEPPTGYVPPADPVPDAEPTPEPANVPPVGAFDVVVANDLSVLVDGGASSDVDGVVTGWGWSFGDGATASDVTATHTYDEAGTYSIVLTVVDDDGATHTVAKSVTVTAPEVPETVTLAADAFDRTVANSWGTADTGGEWVLTGNPALFSVAGGAGRQSMTPAGVVLQADLLGVSSTDTEVRARLALDKVPGTNSVYLALVGRRVGSTDYRARLRVYPTGPVVLQLLQGTTTMSAITVPGVTYAAGDQLEVRAQVVGTSPTTVRAKVWRTGSAEPDAWLLSTDDSTAALQAAGSIAVASFMASTVDNPPIVLTVENLWSGPTTSPPPPEPTPTEPAESIRPEPVRNLRVTGTGLLEPNADGVVYGYADLAWDGSITDEAFISKQRVRRRGSYYADLSISARSRRVSGIVPGEETALSVEVYGNGDPLRVSDRAEVLVTVPAGTGTGTPPPAPEPTGATPTGVTTSVDAASPYRAVVSWTEADPSQAYQVQRDNIAGTEVVVVGGRFRSPHLSSGSHTFKVRKQTGTTSTTNADGTVTTSPTWSAWVQAPTFVGKPWPIPTGTQLRWNPTAALMRDWGTRQDAPGVKVVNVTSNKLTFSAAGDYEVRLPTDGPLQLPANARFSIDIKSTVTGAVRYRMIGGEIKTSPQSTAISVKVRGASGREIVAYHEGVLVSGGAKEDGWQIDCQESIDSTFVWQNCKVARIYGIQAGAHADPVQAYGGPATVLWDRVEWNSDYQGMMMNPMQFGRKLDAEPGWWGEWDYRNVDVRMWKQPVSGGSGIPFYTMHDWQTHLPHINYESGANGCFARQMDGGTVKGHISVGAPLSAGNQTPGIWDRVQNNVAPPGGTVLLSGAHTPGVGYASPGYAPVPA